MNRMVDPRLDDMGDPGFMGSRNAGDNARIFAGARRHSRRVRLLKIAIPSGVAIGLLLLALSTFLNPVRFLYKLPNDLGTLVVSGSKIKMESPRLAGFTRDQRAYEVNAKAAAQDLTKPDLVELQELRAKLGLQDNNSVEMVTSGGVYNTKSEMLTLGPNILMTTTNGYEARLADAHIDIRKGYIVSDKPVEVKMLRGKLNANKLEVINSGEILRFDNGVAMTLIPDQSAAPATPQIKAGVQ